MALTSRPCAFAMRAATGVAFPPLRRRRLGGRLHLGGLRLRLHGAVRSGPLPPRCGTAPSRRGPSGPPRRGSPRSSRRRARGPRRPPCRWRSRPAGRRRPPRRPTFTRHSRIVPSATESPISGKVTSTVSPPASSASGAGSSAAAGAAAVAVRFYLAEHSSHLNRLIGLGEDLYKRPGGWSGNLGVDLVGGDLDERLVRLHAVADLLQPAEDRALGDRLAHLGHGDLNARGAGCHPPLNCSPLSSPALVCER